MTRAVLPILVAVAFPYLLAPSAAQSAGVCDGDVNWKPGSANNLETCRPLWDGVGTPGYTTNVDATPVCHTAYVLSHNNSRKTPDWVLGHLTKAQAVGRNARPNQKFQPEKNVCPAARAVDNDYAGSNFDRGHQAPSNDFKSKLDLMVESFILSNVVPQVGLGFNRGIWKDFEALVRDLAISRGEIYVITGPIYSDADGKIPTITSSINTCRNRIKFMAPAKSAICNDNNDKPKAQCKNGVAVPVGLYKIIYDPALQRANAYVLPNIDHRDLETDSEAVDYLKRFRTSLKVVERFTGLQLLNALPSRLRRIQINNCPATMLH